MKPTRILLAAVMSALASAAAFAGTADVRYIDPDRFTDLATMRSQEHANMTAFESHIRELAAGLPAGQVLRVDVLDVDLAGTVRHNRAGDRRVASGLADSPHFYLRYALESNGQVVKSGQDRVSDLDYNHGFAAVRSNSPLYYEKRLLTRWFTGNFMPEAQAAR